MDYNPEENDTAERIGTRVSQIFLVIATYLARLFYINTSKLFEDCRGVQHSVDREFSSLFSSE